MKAKKRPWRLDYSRPSRDCPVRILGDGEVARIVYRGESASDSCEANARLIVSCVNALADLNPEAIKGLVEAAKRFVKYYQGSQKSHLGNGQAYKSHTELEQALAALKEGK